MSDQFQPSKAVDIALLVFFGLSVLVGKVIDDNASIGTLLGWSVGVMLLPAMGYLATRRAKPVGRIALMAVLWVLVVGVMWGQQTQM